MESEIICIISCLKMIQSHKLFQKQMFYFLLAKFSESFLAATISQLSSRHASINTLDKNLITKFAQLKFDILFYKPFFSS